MSIVFVRNTSNYMGVGINQLGPLLNGASHISGHAWVMKDSHGAAGDSDYVLAIPIDNSAFGLQVCLRRSNLNRLDVRAKSRTLDNSQGGQSPTNLNLSQWYSIGWNVNFPNDRLQLYLNGVQEADFDLTSGAFGNTTYTNGTPTTMGDMIGTLPATGGTTPLDTNRQLAGRVAHLALWKCAASPGGLVTREFEALAQGQLPFWVRSGELAAWFPLWGVGGNEPDYIGRKTGTITGTLAGASHPPCEMFTPAPHSAPYVHQSGLRNLNAAAIVLGDGWL